MVPESLLQTGSFCICWCEAHLMISQVSRFKAIELEEKCNLWRTCQNQNFPVRSPCPQIQKQMSKLATEIVYGFFFFFYVSSQDPKDKSN